MTTFDAELRQRMLRLDAAIPEPSPLRLAPTRIAAPRSRRAFAFLCAAALLLAFAAAVVAGQHDQDQARAEIARQARERVEAERRADEALALVFPRDTCLSLDEATHQARQALDAAGLGGWQVLWDNDLLGGGCATYRLDLDHSPAAVEITQRQLPGDPTPRWTGGDGE
jgi:hypothetical protein